MCSNNGNIDKARYCESTTGANKAWRVYQCYIKHTWRTHKFFKIEDLKHQSEEVCQSKDLQPKLGKRFMSGRTSS